MKKIFSIIIIYFLISVNSNAQSKMNFSLAKKVQSNSSLAMDIFVKGNIEVIKQCVTAAGGRFKYAAGNIAAVNIPINEIGKLAKNKEIKRLEAYPPNLQILNDSMLSNTNILPVHSGQSPLTQTYDGTGVVVGFIDVSIDYTHGDFVDSLGKTRIKYLWDQNQSNAANTPQPFNYGREWTNIGIDAGLATGQNVSSNGGHGTHVAGTAVGNGLASGTYKGVAPKSDIIFVDINFNSYSSTILTDAIYYIFSKAQTMGKPCVINASLGTATGSHDGQDLSAQLIRNMLNQQPGRALAAAVGNDGSKFCHLGYNVGVDTNFTIFKVSSTGNCYLQLWADTTNLKNVNFAIGADKMTPSHSFRGRTKFEKFSTINMGVDLWDTIKNSAGKRLALVEKYADLVGGSYSMEYLIYPDSTTYNWRLITTGAGKFDLWNYNIINNPLPSLATMPDSMYYKLPDNHQTMMSGFQCLDEVITVGWYTNRKSFVDFSGSVYTVNSTPGAISASSSQGPTRDGRIKPDIATPGDFIISAVPQVLAATLGASSLSVDGKHVRNGSSSHACPIAAGVAALYLQKNPMAFAQEVQHAIVTCAKKDQFTGNNLPNNYWGYGKVDAFKTLTQCSIVGINEYNLINQNQLSIYPNPSFTETIISVDISALKPTDKAELKIYNTIGELVKTIIINGTSTHFTNSFYSGVYFCNLFINGNTISSQKLVVLQ